MLKPISRQNRKRDCLITVQDNTMLKLTFIGVFAIIGLITVQDNTMLKLTK